MRELQPIGNEPLQRHFSREVATASFDGAAGMPHEWAAEFLVVWKGSVCETENARVFVGI